MKGLFRYLSPFSPDQSGAASVLYELGGIIVIMDAGGCAGNICGFDEPRWFRVKSAVYSAGLRDMDAILGRDDKLIEKTGKVVDTVDASFIALISTPVPAVVGTDLKALTRICEKRFGLPALYVDTTGIPYYDDGQRKAYMALLRSAVLPAAQADGAPTVGIWGATPLDMPADDSAFLLRQRLLSRGETSVSFGMESSLDDFKYVSSVKKNIVVSPSGLEPARHIEKEYGIPYECGFLFEDGYGIPKDFEGTDGNVLIIHQQVYANEIRKAISEKVKGRIDTASFFRMDECIANENDIQFESEHDFIKKALSGNYSVIMGDPTFTRALSDFKGTFIPLPHYAVSGEMHQQPHEKELFA